MKYLWVALAVIAVLCVITSFSLSRLNAQVSRELEILDGAISEMQNLQTQVLGCLAHVKADMAMMTDDSASRTDAQDRQLIRRAIARANEAYELACAVAGIAEDPARQSTRTKE